ncbi:ABC transporter permease [Microbacterium sp. NPDC057407]|uniref:ABC transporter permease n=1 Tax=Microbacterium sp. NPDC057407 TaxID=3346120 RepID=UPI003671DED4
MSRFRALLAQRVRRDRVQLVLWTAGTALLAYSSFVGVSESYGTEQDRTSLLAAALANPVILLFRGLPSGTDEGAFMVFLIFPWLAFLAAMMSTFLAVRHTRAEEETGRAEVVGATPAGRLLPAGATAVEGLAANAVLGTLVALAYLAVGLPVEGSLLAGFAVGAVGVTFLGVGLVAAQLMRTARSANSLAVWITVGTLVLAGIGNAIGTPSDDLTRMESSWLTWLSPFGWGENTRAFDENAWWPALVCLGVGLALAVVSLALTSARDVGEGFVAERHGREHASAVLSSTTGLVWRLTRGAVLGWAVGGLLTGLLSTSLASIVAEVGASNPSVEQILDRIAGGGDITQATVTVFFTMLGILAACAAVQVVCHARQEEAHGTAEPVLAAPVARVRWLADYLVVALLAIVLVVAAAVVGAAAGIAGQDGDWDLMRDVLVTGGGQVVAASVFLAITALIFVIAPRLTIGLGWTLVLLAMTLGLFGPLFGFPEWVTNLSPVAVAPVVEGDDVDLAGLWWLVAATGAGAALSLGLMQRRELAPAG